MQSDEAPIVFITLSDRTTRHQFLRLSKGSKDPRSLKKDLRVRAQRICRHAKRDQATKQKADKFSSENKSSIPRPQGTTGCGWLASGQECCMHHQGLQMMNLTANRSAAGNKNSHRKHSSMAATLPHLHRTPGPRPQRPPAGERCQPRSGRLPPALAMVRPPAAPGAESGRRGASHRAG